MRGLSQKLVLALLFSYLPMFAWAETTVHVESSLYHTIYIVEDNGMRCLRFTPTSAGGTQTCFLPYFPDELQFPNIKMMLGALYIQPDPKKILMIGLGGGSLPTTLAKLYPEAMIETVEIDPTVIKIAEKYFEYHPGPKQRAVAEDGRVFVKRAREEGTRYDLILLDAFNAPVIPEHLTTREFLAEVKNILAPHGAFTINTVPRAEMYDHESTTYESVFGKFFNLRTGGNRVILIAADGLPTMDVLQANAARLDARLSRFGLDSNWLFPYIMTTRDWDPTARILTDQYAPSNLLGVTPR